MIRKTYFEKLLELIESKIPLIADYYTAINVLTNKKYLPVYIRDFYDQPFRLISRLYPVMNLKEMSEELIKIFSHYDTLTIVIAPINGGNKYDIISNENENIMLQLMKEETRQKYENEIIEEIKELEKKRIISR